MIRFIRSSDRIHIFTSVLILVAIAFVSLLWIKYPTFVSKQVGDHFHGTSVENELPQIGIWGDQYGGFNAFFSALAFVLIAVTLFLQIRTLDLQRKDLKATREEFTLQRIANEITYVRNAIFAELANVSTKQTFPTGKIGPIDSSGLIAIRIIKEMLAIYNNKSSSEKDEMIAIWSVIPRQFQYEAELNSTKYKSFILWEPWNYIQVIRSIEALYRQLLQSIDEFHQSETITTEELYNLYKLKGSTVVPNVVFTAAFMSKSVFNKLKEHITSEGDRKIFDNHITDCQNLLETAVKFGVIRSNEDVYRLVP